MIQVVKVGGGIIENNESLNAFLQSFHDLKGPKVLVHGGGRLATDLANKMGIETKMVEGRRITDEATLEVVTMVYAGLANKTIVAKLQALGTNAMGLCGADANLILSHKRNNSAIDYGWVGDVDAVNGNLLLALIQQGITPVISPITHNKQGNLLNTNADTIASEVAKALAQLDKTQLILGFELAGVLTDPKDESTVIAQITPQLFKEYQESGVVSAGMIPKLTNAFEAIQNGVSSVKICHALKVGEAANNPALGTLIVG